MLLPPLTADFISSAYASYFSASTIPAACILRQVKLDYARIMRRSADGYKMNVKLDIVKE